MTSLNKSLERCEEGQPKNEVAAINDKDLQTKIHNCLKTEKSLTYYSVGMVMTHSLPLPPKTSKDSFPLTVSINVRRNYCLHFSLAFFLNACKLEGDLRKFFGAVVVAASK